MRNHFLKFALAAILAFAITLTFSCSSDDGGGGGDSLSYQGQTYKTVKIGSQTWMAENLNYDASGVCYDNNPANCAKYGRLYNWAAAMALPSKCLKASSSYDEECVIGKPHQGICPGGWHLPIKDEWTIIIGSKSVSNFAALLGGYSNSDGDFGLMGKEGVWWTASEYNASEAHTVYIHNDDAEMESLYDYKSDLYSVRCVQN